jgi:hypothetical protein
VRELGETEVQQLRARRGEHDVGGFEIAVDDAMAVGAVQRIANFHRHSQCFVNWQGASPQPLRERRPLDVLHDDVVGFALAPHIEDGTDVRVTQTRQRCGFALESRLDVRTIGDVHREDLDGHDAVEPMIAGPVHLTHATGADRRDDLVGAEFRSCCQRHPASLVDEFSDARLPAGCTWWASSGENSRGLSPISLATGLPPALFRFAQTTSTATDASGATTVAVGGNTPGAAEGLHQSPGLQEAP